MKILPVLWLSFCGLLNFSPDEPVGETAWQIRWKGLQPFLARGWLGDTAFSRKEI